MARRIQTETLPSVSDEVSLRYRQTRYYRKLEMRLVGAGEPARAALHDARAEARKLTDWADRIDVIEAAIAEVFGPERLEKERRNELAGGWVRPDQRERATETLERFLQRSGPR